MATLPASTHLLEISWAPAGDIRILLKRGFKHFPQLEKSNSPSQVSMYIGGAVSGRQGEVSILGIINPTSDTGALFTGAGPARPRAQPSRTLVLYTCKLYTSTLVHLYTSTVHVYTCTHVHFYTCILQYLFTCTLVHLFAFSFVHLYN